MNVLPVVFNLYSSLHFHNNKKYRQIGIFYLFSSLILFVFVDVPYRSSVSFLPWFVSSLCLSICPLSFLMFYTPIYIKIYYYYYSKKKNDDTTTTLYSIFF